MKITDFRLIRAPLYNGSPFTYDLLVKQHVTSDTGVKEDHDKTLFVINLERSVDTQVLQRFFRRFGEILRVERKEVDNKGEDECMVYISNTTNNECHKGLSKAGISNDKVMNILFVFYKEKKSLQNALKSAQSLNDGEVISKNINFNEAPHISMNNLSLQKCTNAALKAVVPPEVLQREVNSYMRRFDKQHKQRQNIANKEIKENTLEGFVRVQAGRSVRTPDGAVIKSAPSTLNNSSHIHKLPFIDHTHKNIQKKKKSKRNIIKTDFYKFQHTETQQNALANIRQNLLKDTQTIEDMKNNNKFNIEL